MTTNPTWRPAHVIIDGGQRHTFGPYPAEVRTDEHWNGAAIPRFHRHVADRIAADCEVQYLDALHQQIADYRLAAAMDGHPGDHPALREPDAVARLVPVGDAYVLVSTACPDQPELIDPDAEGMYAIGARSWAWQELPLPDREEPAMIRHSQIKALRDVAAAYDRALYDDVSDEQQEALWAQARQVLDASTEEEIAAAYAHRT
ncbi:hypothetical protein [Nonomuraea typhae]|uniref:hypothetical protein n=1 Tax=Nonomuraea typhae TaxID=2603600 RepID=UPI0012FB0A97|nr:hypothetical protein [Nonomuraea typhae]